jgi:TRAP-type C4-dicarboxylate transport system permease small subunit
MLKIINRIVSKALGWLLALFFAAMIATVFLQVFARNVLEIPLVWTLDVAQLLFAWCIFLGAALALRWDAHYSLDLVPENWRVTGSVFRIIAHLGAIVVVWVLLVHGWSFTLIGFNRIAPAIGITEFWFFLPIPLSGAAMALFLAEMIPADLRQIRDLHAKNKGAEGA